MKETVLSFALFLCASLSSARADFSMVDAGLPALVNGNVTAADYNNDGLVDFLHQGFTTIRQHSTFLYRGNGRGTFTLIDAGFPLSAFLASAAWADMDQDGDLDIAMMPLESNGVLKIYRNDGNDEFTEIQRATGDTSGSVVWGNFDGDGKPDLLAATRFFPRLYFNPAFPNSTSISFTPSFNTCAAAAADYDGDGLSDVVVAGHQNSGPTESTLLFHNDGNNSFTPLSGLIVNVRNAALDWGDYNLDGRPDLVISGLMPNGVPVTRVYRNDGSGILAEHGVVLPGVSAGTVAWADFNIDGRLDLFISGNPSTAKIYTSNVDGSFTEMQAGLIGVNDSRPDVGDIDGDGDVDIIIAGPAADSTHVSNVYLNDVRNSISGIVTSRIAPLSGVKLTLEGARTATTTSDATGAYRFSNLPVGAYTVRASQLGVDFLPASITIDKLDGLNKFDQNFTGGFTVSGLITDAGTHSPVVLNGPYTATTSTDSTGHYTFSLVPAGSYVVMPTSQQSSFNPPSQQVMVAGHTLVDSFSRNEIGFRISSGASFTRTLEVILEMNPPIGTSSITISNRSDFQNSQTFTSAPSVNWNLNSLPQKESAKAVYVRFNGVGFNNEETFTDDIVLDRGAPVITNFSVESRVRQSRAVGQSGSYSVSLSARDQLSGVDDSQFTIGTRRTPFEPFKKSKTIRGKRGSFVSVRVRDGAGNVSKLATRRLR